MKRRLVSIILVIAFLITLPIGAQSKESALFEKEVLVVFDGVSITETILIDDEQAYAPVSWLTYFGLMKCAEEDGYYKFYYPDQDKNERFAKRIWIAQDGTSYDVRYYENNNSWFDDISEYCEWIKDSVAVISEYEKETLIDSLIEIYRDRTKAIEYNRSEANNSVSILSGEFSSHLIYKDELYLSVAELLPFMNAKISISEDGIIYIAPNYISFSQALYDTNIGSVTFRADSDMVASEFVSAVGWVVDTVADFRFDRLPFISTLGEIADYQEVFKALLTEDTAFLSQYDSKNTPHVQSIEDTYTVLKNVETALKVLESNKKTMDYVGLAKELYPDSYFIFEEIPDSDSVTYFDMFSGAVKLLDYHNTLINQVDDHRKMLGVVYGRYEDNSPAHIAASKIQGLYSRNIEERFLPAVETRFVEIVSIELPKEVFKNAFPVYTLAHSIAKFAVIDELETVHNSSLLYAFDNITAEAFDAYLTKTSNIDYTTESLEEIRLSAMLTLLSSRYAYSKLWESEHKNIDKIDEMLKRLYLAADAVECDSSDYYPRKVKELNGNIKFLNSIPVEKIVGIWGATIDGEYGEIDFNSDGTGTIKTETGFSQEFIWCMYGKTISITLPEEESIDLEYMLSGKTLYLTAYEDTQVLQKTEKSKIGGSYFVEFFLEFWKAIFGEDADELPLKEWAEEIYRLLLEFYERIFESMETDDWYDYYNT